VSDYYTLLGVDRQVSQEALRRAYRSQIMALHPDRNPGDETACTRAREVIEAYHVLSNPHTRRQYDFAAGYGPSYIVPQASARELTIAFQWFPRLMLVLVFFGLIAALAYGGVHALEGRTTVFRPEMGVIDTSRDPALPVILGWSMYQPNMDAARRISSPASSIVASVYVQTTGAEADSGIRLLGDAAPASLQPVL